MGLAFRRQMPVAGYIVDFAWSSRKLVVDVDGSQHGESDRDAVRDRTLSNLGWTVLRFWNDDILRDIDNVCRHIVTTAGLAAPGRALNLQEEQHP
jgi:very-short-patch-repair endonuclease